jgi:hypothetical protein
MTVVKASLGVLLCFTLGGIAGNAWAQGKAEARPSTVSPNLKRQPEPLSPAPKATKPPPAEGGKFAPPPAGGCPDRGRKLELIA